MEAPLHKSSSVQSIDPHNAEAMDVKTYGTVVAVAMTLNFMIGTGAFGLPYAFAVAGVGLTSMFLIVGWASALITMNYTIESMARAEGVVTSTKKTVNPDNHMTYRKFDFATIGQVFAGKIGFTFVQTVLVLYCFGSLWSYASIFASSLSSIFYTYVLDDSCDVYSPTAGSGCLDAYLGFMVLFAIMSINFVLMDLGDQAGIQKFLAVYRIVALMVMLTTLAVKLGIDGMDSVTARLQARQNWSFNWHNFSAGFGPTLLALNCQYNMPNALQPLHQDKKQHARAITFGSMTLAAFCYLMLGLLGSIAFDNVNPLASLMWSDYSGCGNGWDKCESGKATWFGSIIHILVLMGPVMNVTSSFPMVGITVGGNIYPSLPKSITAPLGPHKSQSLARLIAIIPPLVLATAFKKIDAIFTVAGVFGFALGLIIPAWFQVVGIKYFRRRYKSDKAEMTSFSIPIISSLEFSTVFLGLTFVITAIALLSLVGFF
ncbi:hypothetical protein THRCLA_03142 [Thraustotheca clavata]|uniref:Amino acid transporter transmembrane domain-containing protein n=1 Tax=Thraustotheca clavata TaxID=74557 RepID=A0A1W0A2Y5_9STRA|nr:hypothetical protein THRCLA_03142 [Thraustotheca clavata]